MNKFRDISVIDVTKKQNNRVSRIKANTKTEIEKAAIALDSRQTVNQIDAEKTAQKANKKAANKISESKAKVQIEAEAVETINEEMRQLAIKLSKAKNKHKEVHVEESKVITAATKKSKLAVREAFNECSRLDIKAKDGYNSKVETASSNVWKAKTKRVTEIFEEVIARGCKVSYVSVETLVKSLKTIILAPVYTAEGIVVGVAKGVMKAFSEGTKDTGIPVPERIKPTTKQLPSPK